MAGLPKGYKMVKVTPAEKYYNQAQVPARWELTHNAETIARVEKSKHSDYWAVSGTGVAEGFANGLDKVRDKAVGGFIQRYENALPRINARQLVNALALFGSTAGWAVFESELSAKYAVQDFKDSFPKAVAVPLEQGFMVSLGVTIDELPAFLNSNSDG